MAHGKKRTGPSLPANLGDLRGHVEPDDAVWLAEWIVRRVATHLQAPVAATQRSAFLKFLVDCVEAFEARERLSLDPPSYLTRLDASLVSARERLAGVFKRETQKPRRTAAHRAWQRLVALSQDLPALHDQQLDQVRAFEAVGKPSVAAAKLLAVLFGRSVSTQNKAKARLKGAVHPAPIDEVALLDFVLARILGSSPAVRKAVTERYEAARAAERHPGP